MGFTCGRDFCLWSTTHCFLTIWLNKITVLGTNSLFSLGPTNDRPWGQTKSAKLCLQSQITQPKNYLHSWHFNLSNGQFVLL